MLSKFFASVRALTLCIAVSLASGCASSRLATDEQAAPRIPKAATELRQANLLVRPVVEAETLLGRSVTRGGPDAWRIAPERAPGCEVRVVRTPLVLHERKQVAVRSVAALDLDYASLAELRLDHHRIASAEIDIENSEVIRADLAGPCGSQVITTVYVGRGRQAFFGGSSQHVGGGVGVAKLGASASSADQIQIGDWIEWSTPSAYAFEYRRVSSTPPLQVKAALPSVLVDGDLLRVSFTASQKAFLIVFAVDEAGRSQLLWPSNEEPDPTVTPADPIGLPSSAEKAAGIVYRARLTDSTRSAKEALLIYALSDQRDFEALKPEALAGPDYESALRKQLSGIPARRWARRMYHYTIEPSAGAQSPPDPTGAPITVRP